MTDPVYSLADIPEFAQREAMTMIKEIISDAVTGLSQDISIDYINSTVKIRCDLVRDALLHLFAVKNEYFNFSERPFFCLSDMSEKEQERFREEIKKFYPQFEWRRGENENSNVHS